jgi:aminoglycoside phosphotransferase
MPSVGRGARLVAHELLKRARLERELCFKLLANLQNLHRLDQPCCPWSIPLEREVVPMIANLGPKVTNPI